MTVTNDHAITTKFTWLSLAGNPGQVDRLTDTHKHKYTRGLAQGGLPNRGNKSWKTGLGHYSFHQTFNLCSESVKQFHVKVSNSSFTTAVYSSL